MPAFYEALLMETLLSFLVSVVASVAVNFVYNGICKWLNGRKK